MKKLDLIKQKCEEAINDHEELCKEYGRGSDATAPERYRAELAEEILEILNGGQE